MRIILASKSPRRKLLLKKIIDSFDIIVPETQENFDSALLPEQNVIAVAERKAEAVFSTNPDALVIAADTTVFMPDAGYFGKPSDEKQAEIYLRILSGRQHNVYTGVCILSQEKKLCFSDKADVLMKKLSDTEIEDYIKKFKPLDKAGAYGYQDGICSSVKGYESTVIGLPVEILREKLRLFQELKGVIK